MTISPHDTNQICSCRLLFSIPMTTYPLPSKSWHSEFRTVVQGLVCLFVCFLPYNIGHFFFNSGIPLNAPASRPWQYRPIGASGSQHQPIGARRVSRPPALPGINGHSQIPTDGSTLMRILWMRSGLNGKNGKRIVQLLKPINSSHNPNPIPNLWLGFSKDPKVLRNKDLPPSPRPKAMIRSNFVL